MKASNECITISGTEFVASEAAAALLQSCLKDIAARNRFNRKAKKELTMALRDILIDSQGKKPTPISVRTARHAVDMVGAQYEGNEVVQSIQTGAAIALQRLKTFAHTYVLTEPTRKKLFYFLAACMLLPIGLSIASLPVLAPNSPEDANSQMSLSTVIGPVTLGDYAKSTAATPVSEPHSLGIYAMLAVFILAFSVLVLLAQRSKYTLRVGVVFLLCLFGSYFIQMNEFDAFQAEARGPVRALQTQPHTPRAVDDFDTLSICGASINYVKLGPTAGDMFYQLYEKGFRLAHEFQSADPKEFNYTPSQEELCQAYDTLRLELPNESIVLQTFVKNTDGTIRPDTQTRYSPENLTYTKLHYGFFTIR